jgi:hypothetical protein
MTLGLVAGQNKNLFHQRTESKNFGKVMLQPPRWTSGLDFLPPCWTSDAILSPTENFYSMKPA